ncbi:MAG: hypothetical protein JNK60_22220, partial [Acidobacteria bacterium]|nr:hypothetical protein [Acidobacteriota bacterium]
MSNGIAYRTVSSVHIDPSAPSTQYLTNFGMLFKTMNAGATWESLGFETSDIRSFLVDPVNPSNLHANTIDRGLVRSTDAGRTWWSSFSLHRFGLSSPLALSSSAILAGTYGSGLLRSTDGGASWSAAGIGLPAAETQVLAASPSDPELFFAARGSRVFRSTDAGATFTETNTGLPDLSAFSVASIALSPTSPATVLLGVRQNYGPAPTVGVFRSSDAGTTWSASSEGLRAERLSALAFDPSNPDKVWAGSVDAGLFTSTNGGRYWTAAGTQGFAGEHTRRLATSPAAPGRVLAAAESKLFRSSDSGRFWETTSAVISEAIAADPRDPAVLYAAAREEGILKSTDGGDSWTRTSLGLTLQSTLVIVVDPVTTANVYVGTWQGVHKSTDAGASWTKTPLPEMDVQRLVIDPASPETVIVATGGHGVQKSTDGGASWIGTTQGPTYVWYLVLCPSRPSTLYASGGTSILRSTNSGSSWESRGALPKGLNLFTPAVRALAVDPEDPSLLYAGTFVNTGTHDRGLYQSSDGGLTWRAADAGLPADASVVDLAVEPCTGDVYAALDGRGVFRMTRASGVFRLVVPAAARAEGLGGAFYTTDLTVANTGSTPALFSLELAAGDTDRGEPRSFSLAPGASRTFEDVLGSLFERSRGFGAIRIATSSAFLCALSQTSTPGFGGTLGHSVPAARPEDLVVYGKPRSILSVRETADFRTNLILANAREESLEVDLALVDASGETRGEKRVALPPLGMTQVFRVVRELGIEEGLAGARLVVSAATLGGAFAAYAVAIDNVTNDPRTLLPAQVLGTVIEPSWPPPPPNHWILPAGARSQGPGGAFYTTDAAVAY